MVSITESVGITADSPATTASRIRVANSLVASPRAASWTKTQLTEGESEFTANRTESLRNTPPVITLALSPTIFRYSASYPCGAVMTISSTTDERAVNARSNSDTPWI